MERLSWSEAKQYLIEYNRKYNHTSKGNASHTCVMVAVIKSESFDKEYTLEERSYKFTNDNKAFIDGMGGYSIFADSLDGSDKGVRLEQYVEYGDWKVDYYYILQED